MQPGPRRDAVEILGATGVPVTTVQYGALLLSPSDALAVNSGSFMVSSPIECD
jgi:hypothetical protein